MSDDPDKTQAEARAAEIREEVAITDQRRAEEEEAKAEAAIVAAQKAEAKKEAARREAEERRKVAVAEAERARERAASAAAAPQAEPQTVSGAAVGSPGFGSDPKAAAAASHTSRHRSTAGTVKDPAAGPDRPEIEVAAVFAGAFVLAKLLKRIGR